MMVLRALVLRPIVRETLRLHPPAVALSIDGADPTKADPPAPDRMAG